LRQITAKYDALAAKYDALANVDQMASWRAAVETPDNDRMMAKILTEANNRLDILEADTPPPA
jgi:hypothetical protein